MSGKELIDSLRDAAQQKIHALRRETDAGVEAIKRRTAERLSQLRLEAAGRQSRAVREHALRVVSEAVGAARSEQLAAEHRLAGRLLAIAREALKELRDRDGYALFAGLAGELPKLDWKTVGVHPADQDRARAAFPRAGIVADGSVTGGVDASTADSRIRVVNTLEKRLERAWPDLLPELTQAVFREAGTHGSPGAS